MENLVISKVRATLIAKFLLFMLALGIFVVAISACGVGRNETADALKRVDTRLESIEKQIGQLRTTTTVIADSLGKYEQNIVNYNANKIKIRK